MASKINRQITHQPISAIIPYERNNKIHSPEQINHIANSIAEFGFNQPIVIDENNIVLVGHGRLLAAQKMGLDEVPTICIVDLTEAQKKAYRIIDNKVSADAPWDFEAVQSEIAALTEMDFDMSEFMDGFTSPVADAADPNLSDPGFNYQEQFAVIVVCKTPAEQQEVFENLQGQGLECKLVNT